MTANDIILRNVEVVKAQGYGSITVNVLGGKVSDVEILLKISREELKNAD